MQTTVGVDAPDGDGAQDVGIASKRVDAAQERLHTMTSLLQLCRSAIDRFQREAAAGG